MDVQAAEIARWLEREGGTPVTVERIEPGDEQVLPTASSANSTRSRPASQAMTQPDPERDRRQLLALLYGLSDMQAVEVTAKYLNDSPPGTLDGWVRRMLEAGVIVVYSRPFIASHGLHALSPAPGVGEHLRSIHNQLIQERNRDYAHTDENAYRMVIELDEPDWLERFIVTGAEGLRETWKPPTPDELDDMRVLAAANREWFMTKIERLRGHLRSMGERND